MRNQQSREPQRPPFQDIRDGLNIFGHLVNAHATGILPFIRKDYGSNYFGINALMAIGIMLGFGAMENCDEMLWYIFLWLLFVTAHRLDAARLARQGRVVHSRFFGESWLAYKLAPKSKRRTVHMLIEPAICLIAGALICPYSAGIGDYLIIGGFSVMMSNGLQRGVMERRVRQMHDAYIEQKTTARMFRGQDDEF